jgi:hypothetical protein
MRLIDLTFLILGLNAVIDGGGVVSMDEARDHIRDGRRAGMAEGQVS